MLYIAIIMNLVFGVNKCLYSVIVSSSPAYIQSFYERCGLKFRTYRLHGIKHIISTNGRLCILEHKHPKTCSGLISYYFDDAGKPEPIYSFNDQQDLLYAAVPVSLAVYKKISAPSSNHWISVIRTDALDTIRNFFQQVGRWVPEKHGSGPNHYATTDDYHVFEIYPARKPSSGNDTLEFLVTLAPGDKNIGYQPGECLLDPDGRRIQFVD